MTQSRSGPLWTVVPSVGLSASGFVFWIVASWSLDPAELGAVTGLFTTSFFLVYLTNLGLPVLVTRYATDDSAPSLRIARVAFAIGVMVASFIGAVVAWAGVSAVEAVLGPPSLATIATGAALIGSLGAATIVDARLLATLRHRTYAAKALFISVGRLIVLVIVAAHVPGVGGVFAAAIGLFALSGVVLAPMVLVLRRRDQAPGAVERPQVQAHTLRNFAIANYFSQLALQAPLFTTPILALWWLGADEYAFFYIAWGAASVLLIASNVLSQTLVAQGSHSGREKASMTRPLIVGVAIAVLAAVAAAAIGEQLAGFAYGADFRPVGALLVPLFLGCAPAILVAVVTSELRLAERNRAVVVLTVLYALLVGAGVALGAAQSQHSGAALGWLAGNTASIPVSLAVLRWSRRSVSGGGAGRTISNEAATSGRLPAG